MTSAFALASVLESARTTMPAAQPSGTPKRNYWRRGTTAGLFPIRLWRLSAASADGQGRLAPQCSAGVTMRLATAILAGVLVATPIAARPAPVDNWLVQSTLDDEDFIFVDANSFKDREEPSLLPTVDEQTYKTAWVTVVHEGSSAAKSGYSWGKTLDFVDCAGDRIATKTLTAYKRGGSVLSTESVDMLTWSDVIPGSIGASEREFMCADASSRTPNSSWHDIGDRDPIGFADWLYAQSPARANRKHR